MTYKENECMFDFAKFGYKDITKHNPIHFIECVGEFFESIHPYNRRFYKKDGDIITILKVGNYYDEVFISGICYYPKGYEKFELCGSSKYINEYFRQTIIAVIKTIKSKINES